MANNNAQNVQVGKPKATGAVFRAPAGTAVPTDSTTALNEAFVNQGYCSEDGLTNANSPSSESIKAWGGDIVYTYQSEKPDTFSFTLIESGNAEVLKTIYGDANITGDMATGLTVKANAKELPECPWVIELVRRDGGPHRIVIPNGKISEIGEIAYSDTEAIGYAVTLSCTPDSAGNTHYEYMKASA